MDKETLSNYGWIVICTLVLAIMIALATPFGEYISGAVKSTTQGLFDVSKNAMDSAGINIEGQSFGDNDDTDMGGDNSGIDDSLGVIGVRFGQDYIVKTDAMYEECVGYVYTFYEDGSAKVSFCGDEELFETGVFSYTETQILPTDYAVEEYELTWCFNIVDNGLGLELYDTEETGKMTLVLRSTIPTPETPVQFDKRYIGEDGVAVFYADGSAKMTDLLETDGDYLPAFTLSYSGTRIYNEDEGIEWSVSADGKTVTIDEATFILCEVDHFIQYGQEYVMTEHTEQDNIGMAVSFNADGSLTNFNGDGETTAPGGVKYVVGFNEGVLTEIVCMRVEYKGKVTYWPIAYATDSEHIIMGDDVVMTLKSAIQYGATFTDGTTLTWNQLKSKYGVTDTAVNANAFQNCTTLKSIILPETVKTIGDYAFDGCASLRSIYIPAFGNLTTIGKFAFQNCTSLIGIALPINCTSIGSGIFSGCTSFEDVRLSPELTSIPSYAFYNCSALEDIAFSDKETSIGDFAFAGCTALGGSIYMPTSLKTIGECAFQDCTSLYNVYDLPVSITNIYKKAFYGCSSLSTLEYDGTMAQWNSVSKTSTWKDNTSLTSVTCSDGSVTLS